MDFLETGAVGSVDYGAIRQGDLIKALEAGSGTDSATMTGGRSLIPQDIESTLVNALYYKRADFKLMNLLKNEKVESTVHEYTRRNEAGDEQFIFVPEGGDAAETNQSLERVTKVVKFMQTYREITLQMRVARTLEDAEASEKEAGTLTLLKGVEWAMFHGDGDVVPVQFDSVNKQIMASASRRNVEDLRGGNLTGDTAENSITELARQIYENGGYATHTFMPPVLAADLQVMVRDRLRLNPADRAGAMVVEEYPTPFSDSIKIAGQGAGPDKFFRIKNRPVAGGDVTKRPDAPSISLGAASATAGTTGFTAATAGTYRYTVFAINEHGVSPAATAANQAVTDGQMTEITITPGTTEGTGFIVCRGKVDVTSGDDQREMFRVANSGESTTVVNDTDDWLPGTGELLMLSDDPVQPSIQWDQFLPLMRFDLFPTRAAIIPFLLVLFGTADVKVPWFHGVIKNVGYTGFDWFA